MQPTKRARRAQIILCAASAAALAVALSGAAQAQDAAQTADLGEVVVTASRIQSAGFTAPTPTTVLGSADLQRRSAVSVQEVINDIPSFRPTTTAQNTASPTNGANSNAGANLVDLRGLGTSRTLLLVNGRRTGGSQDLQQFPMIMTSRIDVVTGGASAAYGSDAVAGVVNIGLDTKFVGLKGEAQYGQTKYGDDETWRGAVAYGADLFGNRGHLLIGGDYSYGKGAKTASPITSDPRPWIAANRGLQVANPCPIGIGRTTACPNGDNGLPGFINSDDLNFASMNPGGIITAGPLKGITFEDGGVPRQFQYGVVIGNNMIGGDRSGVNPSVFNIRPKMERYAALAHFDYKLTDATSLWLEYGNAQTVTTVNAVRPRDQGTITIRSGNPFIPAVIQSEMTRLGLSTLTMGRLNNDGKQPESVVKNNIYRYAGGFEGELGGGWTWDAHAQYGILHQEMLTYGSRSNARWTQSLDAVRAANGAIVCRDPAGGCVPFNIFGPNAASQQARDFVFGTQSANRDTEQTNATFNLHGQPVSTWAGPVAVAAGLEYRKEKVNTTSDPIARTGGWDSGNIRPLSGSYDVKEGYLEAAVPLAKDMTFARSLDLNGAVRYAKYSTAGGATTWKVGGTWEPTDFLLLRSTYSRDIRAPNVNELYQAGGVSRNSIIQFQGPFIGQSVLADYVTTGNVNLKPERANTWTAGFSIRPKFARLRFSADYFNIKIRDQIGSIGAQDITNLCRDGRQEFCSLLTFNAAGTVTSVLNTSVNNARFQTRGWDLEASYVQPLDEIWSVLPGQLTGRAFATKVLEYAQTDQGGYVDRSGMTTAQFAGTLNMPEWTATYIAQYDLDRFSGSVQFRYMGPAVLENSSITGTLTSRLGNKLSSQTTVNLAASYILFQQDDGRRLQVFGSINNLFNRGPQSPIFPFSNIGFAYDNLGMVWRTGLRFQY